MLGRPSCGKGGAGMIAVGAAILSSLFAIHGKELVRKEDRAAFRAEVVGQGPPVVFIPGLNSTGEVWQGTVEALRGDFECHVLTLAGFGGLPPVEPPFLETVRHALLRYIDEEGLQRPAVVGHSLGGFLALSLAAAAPEEIGAVVSVDGVPFLPALLQPGTSVESVRPHAEGMRSMLSAMNPEQLAGQARLGGLASGEEGLELLAAMAKQADPAASGQAVFELMTTDLRPQLAKIGAPALVVVAGAAAAGEEERRQLAERYEEQFRAIPDHRLMLIDQARHFVMLDRPREFLEVLRGFLAEAGLGEAAP